MLKYTKHTLHQDHFVLSKLPWHLAILLWVYKVLTLLILKYFMPVFPAFLEKWIVRDFTLSIRKYNEQVYYWSAMQPPGYQFFFMFVFTDAVLKIMWVLECSASGMYRPHSFVHVLHNLWLFLLPITEMLPEL